MSRKGFAKIQIAIENGTRPKTSLRRAKDFVARGYADWTGPERIRFRQPTAVVVEHQLRAAMDRDAAYWRDIARQRRGTAVEFELRISESTNGIVGTELRPVVFNHT